MESSPLCDFVTEHVALPCGLLPLGIEQLTQLTFLRKHGPQRADIYLVVRLRFRLIAAGSLVTPHAGAPGVAMLV